MCQPMPAVGGSQERGRHGERAAARSGTDGRRCPLTGGEEGIHTAGHKPLRFLPLLCQSYCCDDEPWLHEQNRPSPGSP